MSSHDLTQEVLRLRDRLHNHTSRMAAMEWRLRDVEQLWKHYEPIIQDLRETDRIAEAVAHRMTELQADRLTKGKIRLTRWQRYGVVVAALVAIGSLAFNAYTALA